MQCARRFDRMDYSTELLSRFCGHTAAALRVSILSRKSRRELKRIETGHHGALLTSMTIHATLCTEQALYFVSFSSPPPFFFFLLFSSLSLWLSSLFFIFSLRKSHMLGGVNFVRHVRASARFVLLFNRNEISKSRIFRYLIRRS